MATKSVRQSAILDGWKDPHGCDTCGGKITEDWWLHSKRWMEFGSAMFLFRTCHDCAPKEFRYIDLAVACVQRSKKEGKEWGRAVDHFITKHVEARIERGSLSLVPKVTK